MTGTLQGFWRTQAHSNTNKHKTTTPATVKGTTEGSEGLVRAKHAPTEKGKSSTKQHPLKPKRSPYEFLQIRTSPSLRAQSLSADDFKTIFKKFTQGKQTTQKIQGHRGHLHFYFYCIYFLLQLFSCHP